MAIENLPMMLAERYLTYLDIVLHCRRYLKIGNALIVPNMLILP